MKKKQKKVKELKFKCTCGCRAQLLIQDVDNNTLMIDTRVDGRKKWVGVVLQEKEVMELKEFLKDKF